MTTWNFLMWLWRPPWSHSSVRRQSPGTWSEEADHEHPERNSFFGVVVVRHGNAPALRNRYHSSTGCVSSLPRCRQSCDVGCHLCLTGRRTVVRRRRSLVAGTAGRSVADRDSAGGYAVAGPWRRRGRYRHGSRNFRRYSLLNGNRKPQFQQKHRMKQESLKCIRGSLPCLAFLCLACLSTLLASPSLALADEPPIAPWSEKPWYWARGDSPVLLLGGSDDDNLFQWPKNRLIPQLDRIVKAGGNVI